MDSLVVCNWKTYIKSQEDAVALVGDFIIPSNVAVVVCPSSLHISAISPVAKEKGIALGAQDISVSDDSPQTGRLSGGQLSNEGISYVLVGHVETRVAGVSNSAVAEKAVNAINSGITPILCLSEQGDGGGQSGEEVSQQIKEIFATVKERCGDGKRVVVAYEPSAHIGAEDALKPADIQSIASKLRHEATCFAAPDTPILYGGAVNTENVEHIICCTDIQGLLIGRASVDVGMINRIFEMV